MQPLAKERGIRVQLMVERRLHRFNQLILHERVKLLDFKLCWVLTSIRMRRVERRALIRSELVKAVLDRCLIFFIESRMKTGYFFAHIEIIV